MLPLRGMNVLRPSALRTVQASSLGRLFSWKSRLGRDPEERQRKLESLAKRYTLRRIDALEDESTSLSESSRFHKRAQDTIATILFRGESRVSKLTNIDELDKNELENVPVGTVPLSNIATISLEGSKRSVIVVMDRGNIDRVYKSLKHAFPHCTCTILGRERVEVKIPPITAELREKRGEMISKSIDEFRKELKKSELLFYKEIKAAQTGGKSQVNSLEKIKAEFSMANKLLDECLDAAIDKLGLE